MQQQPKAFLSRCQIVVARVDVIDEDVARTSQQGIGQNGEGVGSGCISVMVDELELTPRVFGKPGGYHIREGDTIIDRACAGARIGGINERCIDGIVTCEVIKRRRD